MKKQAPRKRPTRARKSAPKRPAKAPPSPFWRWIFFALAGVALIGIVEALVRAGCAGPRRRTDPELVELLTTGYCNCEICCGWTTNAVGEAVFTSGPAKGRRKTIGVTSQGKTARPGTVAADLKLFPYGTRFLIPGYGLGRVEDIGGAIKGEHLDLWFPTHEEAKKWGRRVLTVTLLPD